MQISVRKPELEHFIEEQVRAGRYSSAEDVVSGALSILRAHEDVSPQELQTLRAQIAIGIEQAERGEVAAWDKDEIAAEVERRHAEESKGE